MARELDRLYRILDWPDDPLSEPGKKRAQNARKQFENMLGHEFFRNVLEEKKITILDQCSGAGIAGLVLGELLREKGYDVSIVFMDLRRDALEKAEKYAREKGFEAKTILGDVSETHKFLGEDTVDIAILYGLSMPHFDPYTLLRIAASTRITLKPHGVYVVEAADYIYTVFYRSGYQYIVPEEVSEEKIVLGLHKGIDFKRSTYTRAFLDLKTMTLVETDLHFWDIASLAAILWTQFHDIDFMPTRVPYQGLLLAYKPRKDIKETYSDKPKLLEGMV